MEVKRQWKVYALISSLHEFVVATSVVVHIVLAFVIYEIVKYLPVASVRRQHALFCCGHFPPFYPCWDRKEASQSPSHISRGEMSTNFSPNAQGQNSSSKPKQSSRLLPGRASSDNLSASRDGVECGRAGLSCQGRSASFSSIYRRRDTTHARPGSKGKSEAFNGGLTVGEFMEGSAEWLKQQKDRGNDEVVLSLLKALQAERRISRGLYEELEEERVASETAVKEAMAMILRLQEEKCALKLEAAHYRRLAEEKALHDEQAIQLLEEDLCRKESEWRLLEEELKCLTMESITDEVEGVQNEPLHRTGGKMLALLRGVDEAIDMEDGGREGGTSKSLQDTSSLKRHSVIGSDFQECFETGFATKDKRLKRFKRLAVPEEDGDAEDLDSCELVQEDKTVMDLSIQTERPGASDEDEHDASSLIVHLSALEKQLLAFEESVESWNPFSDCFRMSTLAARHGPVDGSDDRDQNEEAIEQLFNSRVLENPDMPEAMHGLRNATASENLGALELSKSFRSAKASEKLEVLGVEESEYGKSLGNVTNYAGLSQILEDEKVVGINFANINRNPRRESNAFGAGNVLEFDEGKHAKRKYVHWEACDEDKHLDPPSFVPSSHSSSFFCTQNGGDECKLEVHGLAPHMVLAEEDLDTERVTIQGINLRLRALEDENTFLRHRSVPSSHEHTSMVLLKEIMQELQGLLKANRAVAAAAAVNEAVPHSDTHLKGGHLKRRHYMDGPAHSA